MFDYIRLWLDWLNYGQDPLYGGKKRSPLWPKARRAHLKKEPCCQVCGTKKDIAVHHLRPYHLWPELELDPTNYITLCNHVQHHLAFGHLGDFTSYNKDCRVDVAAWREKFSTRPYERVEFNSNP